MRRGVETGLRYYALGEKSVFGVLTFARRAVSIVSWASFVFLAGALFAYVELVRGLSTGAAVLIGVLLFTPPLALLHFAMVLRVLRLRFDPFASTTWVRMLLFPRVLGTGLLLNPLYWSSVVVLGLSSVIVVPFAIVLSLL